jgi:phosphate-selective porin O/P
VSESEDATVTETRTLRRWLTAAAIAGACLCTLARADGAGGEATATADATTGATPAEASVTAPTLADAPLVAMVTPELPAIAVPPLPPPSPPQRADEADEPFWLGDGAPKLKIEARLDTGDIAETPDGASWQDGSDAYLKKVRFGVAGRLLSSGKYAFLVLAEHLGQDAREPKMKLDRASVDYAFARALVVRAGKAKVPMSRGSLMSSNDVFLRDPAVVSAIDDVFVDDTQWNLQLRGSAGVLSWAAAVAQGWQQGDPVHKTAGATTVASSEPLLVGRVELALPGFAQPLEETRPGSGRRISLGASYSSQRGIQYAGGAGAEDRQLASLDLTMRVGAFSAVGEADGWLVESTVPAVGTKTPFGGYGQVAWFISGVRLEPAVRYDTYWDQAERGADQRTLTLGLNWYARPERLRVAVEWATTQFGPQSADRLEGASNRTRLQFGADFSF